MKQSVATNLFIKHNSFEPSHIIGFLEGGGGGGELLHYYLVNKKLNVPETEI